MKSDIQAVQSQFIENMGQISNFWGFSGVMGQIYGVLYVNEKPLSMDEVMTELEISKGNVSMNLKNLERWGMVRKVWQKGERKVFYEAESDFMKIFTNVLLERRNRDFERMVQSVKLCLDDVKKAKHDKDTAFLKKRLEKMQRFFQLIDGFVFSILKLAKKEK